MIAKTVKIKVSTLLLAVFFIGMIGCSDMVDFEQTAPNFNLAGLYGDNTSLKEFKGSVVILDFWATWCPPCRMAIPDLIRMQDQYREKGLVIIGISLDDPLRASNNYLQAFKEKFGINYKILRYNSEIMEDYFGDQSPAIPTLFVIDRDGKIRAKVVGYRPAAIENALSEVLS